MCHKQLINAYIWIIIMFSKSAFEWLNPHKQFVLRWDFILSLYFIVEVYSCQSAIGVNLDLLTLHKPTSKGLFAILVQIKHYLIPSIIHLQGHRTLERLNSGDGLIIARDEGPLYILIIEDGHFESKIFVELNDAMTTFLTSRTRMGWRTFIDTFFWLGNAMKLLTILLPLISKTGNSMSGSVILLMWPFLTAINHHLPLDYHFSRIFSMDWFLS